MSITTGLGDRLRDALDAAEARTPGIKHEVSALFAAAHAEASAVLDGQAEHAGLASAAGAWAALHDDVASLDQRAALTGARVEGRLPVHVSADGELWGVGTYENLDPGWTEALIHYLEHRHDRAPFVRAPRVVDIADDATLAIVGDWGTGYWRAGTGAEGVARQVAAGAPDYTIHLGDVYYAGTSDEERAKLVALWPSGRLGSVTLNSNHEMYDGARAYFAALAAPAPFALQGGCSYVALRNRAWLIIGLDTAYFSTSHLYLDGALDEGQLAFLRAQAAAAGDRKIVVVSHHEGLNLAGTATTALWQQVVLGLGKPPVAWYWGHQHNGVVYAPHEGCRPRCVGHGAIPYGDATMFHGSKAALWSESVSAHDADLPERVTNGFARVRLAGPTLTEELVAEDGAVRWAGSIGG
ncbi:MAG: metallophosphoesterase [Myxococcales bacterium]|nr:metallophosphoesterase [Myxococcales bacterium]